MSYGEREVNCGGVGGGRGRERKKMMEEDNSDSLG